jgi:LysM repeat protein
MEQWQRNSVRLVAFLVVSAIFIAAAVFLIVTILSDPASSAQHNGANTEQVVIVDEKTITLSIDPKKAVELHNEESQVFVEEQIQEITSQIETASTEIPEEPTPLPTPTAIPEQVIYLDYIVRPGDSLYSISSDLNSSIELLAINGVDAGDLFAGNVIRVPVANPSFCPGSRAYVVRDRDTVYGIALTFNSTTDAIMAANSFPAGYFIKVTEVICVPVG